MGVLPAPPQLVIFDCDGVLVDSEPIANRILAAAINRLGHSISEVQTRTAMVGHSMVQVMKKILADDRKAPQDDWRLDLQRET